MKILAVDDEPLFLEVLEISLRDLGLADVTPIYSAKEALRELEEGKKVFDCILLDIRMPGMDGVELCRRIRAVAGYKRTPILMVTALTDREFIDNAFAAGASDYLTKPLDALELKARMAMVERLIAEQSRNVLLEQRSSLTSDEDMIETEELEFDFEAPIPLPGFDRIIDYSAIENYLASLSTKDSYAASVFAVAIRNAGRFYATARRVDFVNMLYDVGVTLEKVLQPSKMLIAYAGKGVFVVATSEPNLPDVLAIEDQIRIQMKDFDQIYERDKLPVPQVCVGAAMRKSLFIRPHTEGLIRSAITAVENPPALPVSQSRTA